MKKYLLNIVKKPSLFKLIYKFPMYFPLKSWQNFLQLLTKIIIKHIWKSINS